MRRIVDPAWSRKPTASALVFWNPDSYSGRRMINHPHTGQARPTLRASSLFGKPAIGRGWEVLREALSSPLMFEPFDINMS